MTAWPESPGWYWWRDCDGQIDISPCMELNDQLKVFATKNHRDADYDKYQTYLTREEFGEYGDCEFVKVADECPWKPAQ